MRYRGCLAFLLALSVASIGFADERLTLASTVQSRSGSETLYSGDTDRIMVVDGATSAQTRVVFTTLTPTVLDIKDGNSGEVKALTPGSAVIRATVYGGAAPHDLWGVVQVKAVESISLQSEAFDPPHTFRTIFVEKNKTADLVATPKKMPLVASSGSRLVTAFSDVTYTSANPDALDFSADRSAFNGSLTGRSQTPVFIRAKKTGTYTVRVDSGGKSRTIDVVVYQPKVVVVDGPPRLNQGEGRSYRFRVVNSETGLALRNTPMLSFSADNACVEIERAASVGDEQILTLHAAKPGRAKVTVSVDNAVESQVLNVAVTPQLTDLIIATHKIEVVEGDEVRLHIDYLDKDHIGVSVPIESPPVVYCGDSCISTLFAPAVPGQPGATVTGNDLVVRGERTGKSTVRLSLQGKDVEIPVEVIPKLFTDLSIVDSTKAEYMFGRQVAREFFVGKVTFRNNLDKANTAFLKGGGMTLYGNTLLSDVVLESGTPASDPTNYLLSFDPNRTTFQDEYADFVAGVTNTLVAPYPPTLFPEMSATSAARENRDPGNTLLRGIGYVFQLAKFLNTAYPAGASQETHKWNPLRFSSDASRIQLFETLANGYTSSFTNLKAEEGKQLTADFVMTNTQSLGAGATAAGYVFFPKSRIPGLIPHKDVKISMVRQGPVGISFALNPNGAGGTTQGATTTTAGGG